MTPFSVGTWGIAEGTVGQYSVAGATAFVSGVRGLGAYRDG